MDIRACYDAMGADYEEVFGRFHSEKLIIKFAGKFLDDPSYASLCSTLAAKDYPEAFRAAHTLKGVSRISVSLRFIRQAMRSRKPSGRIVMRKRKLFFLQ